MRATILPDAANGMADRANAAARQVNRNTVVLRVRKYVGLGLEAALGELPRSGKPRQISGEAIAWIHNLACQKPNDLGYAQELWTYQLLTEHVHREQETRRTQTDDPKVISFKEIFAFPETMTL